MYVYTSPSPTSRCSSAGRYSATRRGLVSDGSILRRSMVVGRALGKGRPGVVVRLVASLVRGMTGLGRRRSSCGGDAERAVVVIVVNPAPWRSDLDGWMQSTRVELRRHAGDAVMADGSTRTIGSSQRGSVTTWVRAAGSARASTSSSTLGNGTNHGQWGKVAKAQVSLPPSAHNIGILVASMLKTLKRWSGPFPDRSRFVLRHQSVPVGGRCSWRSPQRCRHAGDINDGEVMFAWIRKP